MNAMSQIQSPRLSLYQDARLAQVPVPGEREAFQLARCRASPPFLAGEPQLSLVVRPRLPKTLAHSLRSIDNHDSVDSTDHKFFGRAAQKIQLHQFPIFKHPCPVPTTCLEAFYRQDGRHGATQRKEVSL